MRLADFILANIEPVLGQWELFARSLAPGAAADRSALRDHAGDILRAAARDMMSAQSDAQRSDKSEGHGDGDNKSASLNIASYVHTVDRVRLGFDLPQMVAEYRALRASVIRLWRQSDPHLHASDLDDLTRFHESIDQSLAETVSSYTTRVDRSRGMFLAILGHDLRSPLNAIALSAAVLSRTPQYDTGLSQLASQIASSAKAMGKMISDLIDFTRTGLGADMPTSPAPMNLGILCREVFDEFAAGHPTHDLNFRSEGDVEGDWDVARLRQAVSNLLANAVQHGSASVPVVLSVIADGSDVLIAVSNGGLSIPSADFATIFEPLVRVSSLETERQRRPGSIGLGLFIAREVVGAHGGTIGVTSSDGAGTVFTIRLPRQRSRSEL